MTLSEISIRRPVLAIVMSTVLVLLGAAGFSFLGVREYPAVDPPIVTVTTNYAGASADVIDSQITEPLEQSISGIAGVRTISSTSQEERSTIRVEFNLDADLETAANDVRDKVAQALRRLPADVNPPVIEKADADSDPVIFLTVQSDTLPIIDVSQLAATTIKERVQTIPGVSVVRIFGEKQYAMRLWLSADRMAAHGVTALDVQRAVAAQNVDLPSGRIEGDDVELSLRTVGTLATPEQFNRITVRAQDGRQIQFEDIGSAELGPQNLRTVLKRDLLPMIGVAVIPQPNTNAIKIADEFYRRLDQVRKELPPEVKVEIGYDFTTYVRRSVTEVEETLAIAFALVALIIYLFLGSWRTTLIPVIAIPISLVTAFFVMYIGGLSINILTLVALVLAIGLVVDDAIVVLENIYTKVELGRQPLQAALEGSREVYFAVISTTVTLAVVFVPVIFLQGLIGRLFREFGVVVACTVMVSAFVSLTLTPMMCRYMLKTNARPGRSARTAQQVSSTLTRAYGRSLDMFLRVRFVAIASVVALLALSVFLLKVLPTELAPLEDRSNIRLNVRAPEGSTIEYTERQLDQLATYVTDNVLEAARTFSIVGVQSGTVSTGTQNIYLKEPAQRLRSQEEVFQQISRDIGRFSGLRVFPAQPPTIGSRSGGLPVQFVVQAPNLEALLEVLPKFLDRAQQLPELRFVDVDLKLTRPEVRLSIDRARAAELGVSVLDVGRTLQLALGAPRIGYFQRDGRQYDVIAQLQRSDRNDPKDLSKLYVRSERNTLISLDNVIQREERAGAAALYRFDRYISATVSAGIAPGYTLGQALQALDRVASELLPEGFATSLAGQSRDFADSSASLLMAFLFALALIYLVLAGQFESFIDPLVIFVTVPLSMAGALGGLWLFGQSLNVFSQIGIIMLVGLVTKNGILIVEFANQRKAQGLSVREAAREAAISRFRPVLMTSLATVLGTLPIALNLGSGSGSRQSLGIAVVAGMTSATVLTLYVVPAVYSYLSRAHRIDG